MNTPIHDFVTRYRDLRPARFHMPGHKGRGPLGCEELDLTEIPGADSLYEASGIIAESEANASRLFGCPTFYSTEGSSHCIRAMLLLAMQRSKAFPLRGRWHPASPASRMTDEVVYDTPGNERERIATASVRTGFAMTDTECFRVLAARNVHKAFLTAAALLDLEVCWLPLSEGSYLSAQPTPETLAAALEETGAQAVYLSCPDYLGFLPELKPLAELCHARGALLLVDNAHGAYLRFLGHSRHPMDLGADLCCDSAHKTLPVLTGGAYLHVKGSGIRDQGSGPACRGGHWPPAVPRSDEATGNGQQATGDACRGGHWSPAVPRSDEATGNGQQATGDGGDGFLASLGMTENETRTVRDALALFGSTSPSYLILQSLDLANPWLEGLPEELAAFLPKVEALKSRLRAAGWRVVGDEPLKLTLHTGDGLALAAALEQKGIFCEFADPDFVVFMLSPQNTDRELGRLEAALLNAGSPAPPADGQWLPLRVLPEAVCTLRQAMLAPAVWIPAAESLGRVLARPCVSCPPAVPILMPGERIDRAALAAFRRYGMERVAVLP